MKLTVTESNHTESKHTESKHTDSKHNGWTVTESTVAQQNSAEQNSAPPISAPVRERAVKALASARRLQILEWLKDPATNFPPQEHGDPVEHGACNMYITDKLGVSQPAASRHMKVLVEAGLVIASPRSGYVYYRRDEAAIDRLKADLADI